MSDILWRVHSYDASGRWPGCPMKKPEPVIRDFTSEVDAREAAREARATPGREIAACVTRVDPTAQTKETRKRK